LTIMAAPGGGGDDDLDALLDGALDELGEQEAQHQEEVRVRDEIAAQAAAEQQAASGAFGFGGMDGDDPGLANLQNVLMSLTQALQDPNSLGTTEGMAQLQKSLNTTIAALSNDPNASPEDQAELARCTQMVERLGQPDDGSNSTAADATMSEQDAEKAQQLVADMIARFTALQGNEGQAAGAAAPAVGGGMDDQQMQEILAMMEAFQKAQLEQPDQSSDIGKENLPDPSRGYGAAAAATAAPGAASDTDMAMLRMVAELWADPNFGQQFRVMAERYPPFLAEHGASLPPADLARYEQQLNAMRDMASFLEADKGPLDPNSERFTEFNHMLERLHSLGAPPPQLQAKGDDDDVAPN
jgi:hypothetical protein